MSTDNKYSKFAVLYVDDEEQALKYFGKILGKEFQVITANSVAAALEILNKDHEKIGIVLTDQRMPNASGTDLLKEVTAKWPKLVRMMVTAYSELDLAALIFHELAHQAMYVPGDSAYNEAFATAVEEEGVARYAAAHADAATLAEWRIRRQLREEVTGLFIAARADLASLYRQRIAPDLMRARKAERIAQLRDAVRAAEQRHGRRSGYGSWFEAGLNNAHLASVATYHDHVPRFEAMLREGCGGYLPCLYVRARDAARADPDAAGRPAG